MPLTPRASHPSQPSGTACALLRQDPFRAHATVAGPVGGRPQFPCAPFGTMRTMPERRWDR